ncbi:SDR family NAD(P)-dependent oxidoreductase, partial [Akkermansiaceae bacterium]|nr:SDR family NAD(P)-dependent oxidoreductase [Akkermansiaceae bacterium]
MSYLESLFKLNGKVAVVIGGTGELCGHIALGMAKTGMEVVIIGRNEEKAAEKLALIEAAGGKAYFLSGDVESRDSIDDVITQVIARSGGVDVLINGAGVNSPTPFLDIAEEEFQRIMDINFMGTVRACQAFGEYFLKEKKRGSIINLGSISGINPLSRVFSYSASKGAVHNLSKNLAREWADQGIRVNTLVPGFFPAEQNRKVLDESRITQILGKTPSKRFGSPEELIGASLL